jgi:hypothetical protein
MTALSGSTPAQLLVELAATRGGDGEAEQIRCEGTRVIPGRSDAGPDVSFGEGDIIVLVTPERNSFKGVWQGNKRDVNSTGDRAKIDSITDLRELATSPKGQRLARRRRTDPSHHPDSRCPGHRARGIGPGRPAHLRLPAVLTAGAVPGAGRLSLPGTVAGETPGPGFSLSLRTPRD